MSLTVNKGEGSDYKKVPEGQYIARCYSLVDVGTQTTTYLGKEKQVSQVVITWELLDGDRMQDGKPFSISKTYTASLNEKSRLYSDLNAWRGKKFTEQELEGFDLKTIVGAYAQLQVVHEEGKNGKTYANVNSIMAFKGTKPEGVNPDVVFEIEEPTAETFNTLPDFLKRKIQGAPEWKAPAGAVEVELTQTKTPSSDIVVTSLSDDEINLDDIPF